jgi:NAD-dependent deacetylase
LLICIGSTLSVRPVAGLVPKALDRGARLVIINAEPTPYDDQADVVVRGDIPSVLDVVLGVSTM